MTAVRAASLEEVPAGRCTLTEVNGIRMVLARVGDQVYACADACSHRGGPLSEGKLTGTRLTCPWHGWLYDVTTGACVDDPSVAVDKYEVKVEGDSVMVGI